MRWLAVGGLALGVVWAGCAGGARFGSCPAPGPAAGWRYPVVFTDAGEQVVGAGFAALSGDAPDQASAGAAAMACRSLAWGRHVRVVGERLVEPMPSGFVVFCGESIRLVDVPEMQPQDCVLDTQRVGGQVWVTAAPASGPRPRAGTWRALPGAAPDWVVHPPAGGRFRSAVGSAPLDQGGEPQAWQAAEYRALVDLAIAAHSSVSAPGQAVDRSLIGVQVVSVDAELRGFRVVARWRDQTRVYVLGRLPAVN